MVHQHEDFSTRVGETFVVSGSPGIEWRLAQVGELQQGSDVESFAIEFEGPPADGAQGLVTLEHTEMGTLELFVVALARGRFEAVFNHLVGVDA